MKLQRSAVRCLLQLSSHSGTTLICMPRPSYEIMAFVDRLVKRPEGKDAQNTPKHTPMCTQIPLDTAFLLASSLMCMVLMGQRRIQSVLRALEAPTRPLARYVTHHRSLQFLLPRPPFLPLRLPHPRLHISCMQPGKTPEVSVHSLHTTAPTRRRLCAAGTLPALAHYQGKRSLAHA